ncbi:Fungal transcriptional regulatory protein [Cordyceps fumosorosea ARSEF 2679]|uniref:Fungal transcriptional regulatory protein n=1 Tax=Cordyceps fumosorosea (strain ARSEF 2679) TaxID=1081104 RepID=A0A168D9P5_CORFA|nr:Fungal transcriptional regulatory protein [Cordyceps fumosorosea ARSEF 2679]OAA72331.1 Fungal transcriptional regulatory protein [Cordyceps fumosorosea ARSEF 2679]
MVKLTTIRAAGNAPPPPPPPGPVDDDGSSTKQRVKRWAPRGKTGCVTCRRRKVRCDEAKPICGNCVATRRYCGGPYYQDSAQASDVVRNVAAVVIPRLRDTAPRSVRPTNHRGWEIAPDGWDVVEAFEYLGLYTIPHSTEMDVMATRPAVPVALAAYPGCVNSESFLARVIADRIVWVSCCQRTALSPSTAHGTKDLWFKFYDLIQKHLGQLNYDLTHHILCLGGWRAHFDGYFALLNMFGIPKRIPKENPVFLDMLRSMTVNAVIGNSVTRIDRQMHSIYDFDDAELVNIFGQTCFTPFPCPKALFAEIAAINRLRLAATTSNLAALLPSVNALFRRINAFQPGTWKDTAEFEIPRTPEVVLVARIFQLAVSLYGVLALGLEHADAGAPPSWPDQTAAAAELITLLRKTLRSPKCVSVMTWPCAVAGVAVADGPEAGRKLVGEILARIDADVLAYGIAAHTTERLRAFWLAKKTGWEECWGGFYLLW